MSQWERESSIHPSYPSSFFGLYMLLFSSKKEHSAQFFSFFLLWMKQISKSSDRHSHSHLIDSFHSLPSSILDSFGWYLSHSIEKDEEGKRDYSSIDRSLFYCQILYLTSLSISSLSRKFSIFLYSSSHLLWSKATFLFHFLSPLHSFLLFSLLLFSTLNPSSSFSLACVKCFAFHGISHLSSDQMRKSSVLLSILNFSTDSHQIGLLERSLSMERRREKGKTNRLRHPNREIQG